MIFLHGGSVRQWSPERRMFFLHGGSWAFCGRQPNKTIEYLGLLQENVSKLLLGCEVAARWCAHSALANT